MNTTALEAYLTIALELSQTAEDVPLATLFSKEDIAPLATLLAEEELFGFISDASEKFVDLYEHFSPVELAENFFLTRNGHGSGFLDDTPSGSDRKDDIAKALTDIAIAYGESQLFIGDDDKLHFE